MDQEWTKIELDELYLMDYLLFAEDPPIIEKIPKYYKKTEKTVLFA